MASSKQSQDDVEVLETGNIYFVYRPKVQEKQGEEEPVEGLEDIQRFNVVLKPNGKKTYRMLVMGRKQLPDATKQGDQAWGFVEAVSKDPGKLEQSLRAQTYQTQTRGERELPAARPAGEGVYQIVRHGDHTHLAYALELPMTPGEAQDDLNIEPEGNYILQVKNPTKSSPRNAGLPRQERADLPNKLQASFKGRRFASVESLEILEYEGVELLLIAASDKHAKDLGVELDPEKETEQSAEILSDLRMRKSRHPIEPLLSGEWR